MRFIAPKALAAGLLFGAIAGIFGFPWLESEREELAREIEEWRTKEWEEQLLEERRREFMDQMERKHL